MYFLASVVNMLAICTVHIVTNFRLQEDAPIGVWADDDI